MELKRILSQYVYRIEPKPGGGFIATCKDPARPPIEGATRNEVSQKIQETIATEMGAQFPALKTLFENNQVKMHYHIDPKPGGGYVIHHGDPDSPDASHAPSDGSTRDRLESLIESKLFSTLMQKVPPELQQQITEKLNSGGLDVVINRSVTFNAKTADKEFSISSPQLPNLQNAAQLQDAQIAPQPSRATNETITGTIDQSPITYEKSNSGAIFRFLIALLILAGIVFLFLHRR